MKASLETRLAALEKTRAEKFGAALGACLDWIEQHETPERYAAFIRVIFAGLGIEALKEWGDPQPDDQTVADEVDAKIPLELVNVFRKLQGQKPFTDEAERIASAAQTKAERQVTA